MDTQTAVSPGQSRRLTPDQINALRRGAAYRTPRHPNRAIALCRISKDREGLEYGVTRQKADVISLAKEHGFDLAPSDIIIENDTGASEHSRDPRPKYDRIIAAVKAGDYGVILASTSSRLTRRTDQMAEIHELVRTYGVRVIFRSTGELRVRTADERFRETVVSAADRAESDRIHERVLGTLEQNFFDLGKHHGIVPYGYRPFVPALDDPSLLPLNGDRRGVIVVVPERAAVIQEAARRMLDGGTLVGIARDFDHRGIKPPRAAKWNAASLRGMLRNPVYAGRQTFYGREVGHGRWEPILDEDTFDAVRALLLDPARDAVARGRRERVDLRYFLSSVIFCGRPECGGPMRVVRTTPRGITYERYTCKVCYKVSIRREVAEEVVKAQVVKWFRYNPNAKALGGDATEARRQYARAAAIRGRLDHANALYDRMMKGDQQARAEFLAVDVNELANLPAELDEAEARARAAQARPQFAKWIKGNADQVWDEATPHERRDVVAWLFHITIDPHESGRPQEHRVRFFERWTDE